MSMGLTIAALSMLVLGAGSATPASWSTRCTFGAGGEPAQGEVWFGDVADKFLQGASAPAAACPPSLRLSAARGEHLTFQVGVRSATALPAVTISVNSGSGGALALGQLDVKREAFTNVTTAANANTSLGIGMYPDALLPLSDNVIYPHGGRSVEADATSVFWVTLGPIPDDLPAGLHSLQLSVGGTAVKKYPIKLRVWDFVLPDAGHASQWTEADPFGAVLGCNILWEHKQSPCTTT